MAAQDFDAVLVLSFGGPEGPDDVVPFLENVLRGRPVRPGRLEEIAQHYALFGGRSPINAHNRALASSLQSALTARGRPVPVYLGNRHWHPFVESTVRDMVRDGVRNAAVFATSAYSSYSGCRQYLEELDAVRRAIGPTSPRLVKLPPFFDHPGFVEPLADGLRAALRDVGPAPVLMSAHSIPAAQAARCDYETQLHETAARVAQRAGVGTSGWSLVYQSRSGPPTQAWLGPDIVDAIAEATAEAAAKDVIVVPIGFVSDHMEVVYDLDTQAAEAARSRGIRLTRTPTPGTDPRFVEMICELIDELERPDADPARFNCPPGCCAG